MSNLTAVITPQPMHALVVANERRTATALLKRRLRCGELTLAELVTHPPAEAGQALTFEVLLWAPYFGRQRLRALNLRAVRRGHVNLATPLGQLTDRQRQWLASEIRR